jgi:hypothetical protein
MLATYSVPGWKTENAIEIVNRSARYDLAVCKSDDPAFGSVAICYELCKTHDDVKYSLLQRDRR